MVWLSNVKYCSKWVKYVNTLYHPQTVAEKTHMNLILILEMCGLWQYTPVHLKGHWRESVVWAENYWLFGFFFSALKSNSGLLHMLDTSHKLKLISHTCTPHITKCVINCINRLHFHYTLFSVHHAFAMVFLSPFVCYISCLKTLKCGLKMSSEKGHVM